MRQKEKRRKRVPDSVRFTKQVAADYRAGLFPTVQCLNCGYEWTPAKYGLACPSCKK